MVVFETNPRPWEVRRLNALPMFHAATAPSAFCTPLRNGDQTFVMPKFDLEKWFWAHEHYKITDLGVVPPIVVAAINSPLAKKYSLKICKAGQCGAAPLDKGPQARLEALMDDGAPLTQVWGMTETSCIATRHPYPSHDQTGSVGFPIPNLDTKLVDDNGKDITDYDIRGELCVRGPTVIKGYFENPEANARDWDSDGFFHTGDIAFIDGQTKKYYIVDRKKVGSIPTRQQCSVSSNRGFFCSDFVLFTGTHQSPRLPSRPSRTRRRPPRPSRNCRRRCHWCPRSCPGKWGAPASVYCAKDRGRKAFGRGSEAVHGGEVDLL